MCVKCRPILAGAVRTGLFGTTLSDFMIIFVRRKSILSKILVKAESVVHDKPVRTAQANMG